MATIFYRIATIYILLFVTVRILGKRQVGELEVSELITTLLLSEVAALPVADPEIPLLYALIPLLFILSLELLITCLKNRFAPLKSLFEPKATPLIVNGKIDQKALKKLRISVNELMGELRLKGVEDPSDVLLGTVEQNGRLSILFTPEQSPLTKSSADGKPGGYGNPVILDGVLDPNGLTSAGIGEKEVGAILKKNKIELDEVFLLTVRADGHYTITKKESQTK